MKSVIFLIYHGMGHFNACFKIAKLLKRDHDVVFAGVEFFKSYVEGQGFMYYPLKTVPFGMGFEKWVNEQEKHKHPYLHTIKDRWNNRLFKLREEELLQLMEDINPDYLMIDSLQSTDFIVLYPYLKSHRVNIALIQTMLPTALEKDLPPINSLAMPDNKKETKKALASFKLTRLKKKLIQKLQYFGMDDNSMVRRQIKQNKIPTQFIADAIGLQSIFIQQVDEFILAPEEFDFPGKPKNEFQHYIGFMPDFGRIEISDMEYFKIDSLIRNKVSTTGAKLIYCSFGTVKLKDIDGIISFIIKLSEVVRDKKYIVIISVNSNYEKLQSFADLPDNIYILKAAPQLQILERADVFITHGGLNSIKESIYTGVPMLVYPLYDLTDAMGNSSRVVFHDLGLRGDLKNDTVDEINHKLISLTTDERYKKNIFALREIDDNNTEKFLTCFKYLKPLN